MIKRILLFLLTNVLVIATISIITTVFGLHNYLTAYGIDYQALAIFCAIWGTLGSFISLLLSKWMAKMAMGVQIIDPAHATPQQRELLEIIRRLCQKVGISTLPEVGMYDSPELNAFATGPSKNNALVAVSSGLLNSMDRGQIEGVLGHEISHVANGDMVTMTLIQGVINAFSLFLSRVIAYAVSIAISRGEDREGGISMLVYSLLTIVFDILFTILGSIVVAAFSRWREYRADDGGARLVGRDNMVSALERLRSATQLQDNHAPSVDILKISKQPSHFMSLFSSHPPLEKRIQRLMARRI